MSFQEGIKGFTTRILSYDRVEAIVLRPADSIVRYGKLVRLNDRSQEKTFLGMILDVKEETTHPALDVERFRDLYVKLAESSLEDANRVLEELLSPRQELIRWNSIMTVEIRVLGEARDGGLREYDRPPRPLSEVLDPDPGWLERLLHSSIQGYKERGVYIGRLVNEPRVRVYLDMSRFTMHLSVLAQTGGGKTETVKRLVAETMWRKARAGYPKGGAVVFDIAGEYTGHPYHRPDTVPLLDAVLDPSAYGGGADPPVRATIIVPYTLPGWRKAEFLRHGITLLVRDLQRRGLASWDTLVIERFRLYDAITGMQLDVEEALDVIGGSERLVIALPYPSFMTIGELVEYTGATSEYFEVIVEEAASMIDVLDGDEVRSIPAVYTVVKLAFTLPKSSGSSDLLQRRLTDLVKAAAEGRADEFLREERKRTQLFRYLTAQDAEALLSLAKLRSKNRRPNDQDVQKIVKDSLDAAGALRSLYEARTIASVQRRLKKAVLSTSFILGPELFNAIVARTSEGFTIVHLAPPSQGDVDLLLGLLIRKVFSYHVGKYEEDRLTLLVVEEAHNLAPPGGAKSSKEALLRVAREGRKWGLSLWLVTQRPSFVDASLLSQTATSVLLRTTNPDDLSMIRRSVESAAGEIVDRLPELEPRRGEALVAGLAAPERRVPLLVSVERLRRR